LTYMAKLRSELFIPRNFLDQSPLSDALGDGGDSSSIVVQFCASVFHVAASVLYRMDGRKCFGSPACCLLSSRFLPRQRHLHILDLGTYRPNSS